jgi:hypothetical protein
MHILQSPSTLGIPSWPLCPYGSPSSSCRVQSPTPPCVAVTLGPLSFRERRRQFCSAQARLFRKPHAAGLEICKEIKGCKFPFPWSENSCFMNSV